MCVQGYWQPRPSWTEKEQLPLGKPESKSTCNIMGVPTGITMGVLGLGLRRTLHHTASGAQGPALESVGPHPMGGWWLATGSVPACTVPRCRAAGAACQCWLGTWPNDPWDVAWTRAYPTLMPYATCRRSQKFLRKCTKMLCFWYMKNICLYNFGEKSLLW